MKKLTEEQKKLVEDNHMLIYYYAHKYDLNINEYYDLLAIGLCNAALIYDSSKGKFSTVAFTCMTNILGNHWRYSNWKKRKPNEPVLSYDTSFSAEHTSTHSLTVEHDMFKNVLDNIFYTEFYNSLKPKEQFVFDSTLKGMKQIEIADELGCSHQYINQVVKKIRVKLRTYIDKNNQ